MFSSVFYYCIIFSILLTYIIYNMIYNNMIYGNNMIGGSRKYIFNRFINEPVSPNFYYHKSDLNHNIPQYLSKFDLANNVKTYNTPAKIYISPVLKNKNRRTKYYYMRMNEGSWGEPWYFPYDYLHHTS